MKRLLCLCVLQMVLTNKLFAHGMNSLGPNGGYINMPGVFHTELVPNDDGSLKVYLLDVNFKNPTTKDSSVGLKFISKKKTIVFDCKSFEETYFLCTSNEVKEKINKGNIEVKAIRAKSKGGTAKYSFPIKLKEKEEKKEAEHDMSKM